MLRNISPFSGICSRVPDIYGVKFGVEAALQAVWKRPPILLLLVSSFAQYRKADFRAPISVLWTKLFRNLLRVTPGMG